MPVLVLFCLLVNAAPMWAEEGVPVRYVGGTVGAIPQDAGGRLLTTDELFLAYRMKGREHNVPYRDVNLLEYGQNVNRRLGLAVVVSPLFMLSKARKHFLTVGYKDKNGNQQAMVFRVEKSKIRAILVALEARTGLKVTYQDDEARKAGKG